MVELETVTIDTPLILTATDLHAAHSVSFWDALIIAAAQSAGCDEIWAEDLRHGRQFGNLKIVNPFAT